MRSLAAIWEAVTLCGFGIYLTALASGNEYWRLMNPRFQVLTLITGVILAVLGLTALATAWKRRGAVGRAFLFTLLAGLIMVFEGTPVPGSEGAIIGQEKNAQNPVIEYDGQDYTKITTAEVFLLLQQGLAERITGPLVLRGEVKRFPGLDQAGMFVIKRVNMVCCSADAFAVGLVVKSAKYADLQDGDWVRVFGTIQSLPQGQTLPAAERISETYFSVLANQNYLKADEVEEIERAPIPFVFVTGYDPPYQY